MSKVTFTIVNLGLVALALLTPRGRSLGFLAGFVLASSSLFHLLYGERYQHECTLFSWAWWLDTYEVTVQVTYLFLLFVYKPTHSGVWVLNCLYLCWGALCFWLLSLDALTYNACGLLLGTIWMVERW